MITERNTSTERIRAITDMMYELGMYSQSMTVDALAKERDELLKRVSELEDPEAEIVHLCCEVNCDNTALPGENFCQICLADKKTT